MLPTKKNACPHASNSMTGINLRKTLEESASSKLPSVRCAPSIFNKFIEHLNMPQCRKINEVGFGGLLQFPVEGLDSSDLLVYLMDKLNPESMILEVGTEGDLEINELCVRKVLGLPYGDKDPPSSTEEENCDSSLVLLKVTGMLLQSPLLVVYWFGSFSWIVQFLM